MPILSTYPNRQLAKSAGIDASGNVGLASFSDTIKPDAYVNLLSERSTYDGEATGFSVLVIQTTSVYYKLNDGSPAVWSDPLQVVTIGYLFDYENVAAVQAATISGGVNFVRTAGFNDAGDSGGAVYVRSISEPTHAGKIQSADGAWWELELASRFNVKCQGAVGDGSTDDTAAVIAAATAVKATKDTLTGSVIDVCPAYLLFPPGYNYRLTGSINLQSILAYDWGIKASGATIIAECSGKTLFDCLGSAFGFFNLNIVSQAATAPARAIQIGRITHNANPAGGHHFDKVQIDGHFSDSIIYNASGEGNSYINVQLRNNYAGGKPCLITDMHHFSIITDFDDSAWAADELDSCIQHTFINTDASCEGGPSYIWVGSNQVHFTGANYAATPSGPIHRFYAPTGLDTFYDLRFSQHVETFGTPANLNFIEFQRLTSGALSIVGFSVNDHIPFQDDAAVDSLIKAGTNITTLNLSAGVEIYYGGFSGDVFGGPVVVTDEAKLNGVITKNETFFVTLNDDQATSFVVRGAALNSHTVAVHHYGNADSCGSAFLNSDSVTAAVHWGGANFSATTGILSGTTGADGDVTISIHSDHKIYLENRRGATSFFSLHIIGH